MEGNLDIRMSDTILSENQSSKNSKKLKIIIGALSAILFVGLSITVFSLIEVKPTINKVSVSGPIPEKEDLAFTEEEHRKLSRLFATQGMVLATNNGLPLQNTDQVVLFGNGTISTVYGGTGSGEVYQKGQAYNIIPVHIIEGFENKGKEKKIIYVKNEKGYEIGMEGSTLTDGDVAELAVKQQGAQRSVAILTISRISGEGNDRQQDDGKTGTLLRASEIDTYQSLIKHFDKVVVILNVGSVMELGDIVSNEKTSILISFLPGMEAGNAIADVVVGDAYPAGHLSDTWAKTIDDYPTTTTFKESVLYVKYKEGLFMGYRYFEDDEEKQKKVVFPFGYGLSYTTYKIENKNCTYQAKNHTFVINLDIQNIGSKNGKEVIQIYVEKPQNENFIKTKRELVAFIKTKELKPNETQHLQMFVNLYNLASYDDTGVTGNKACYVLEKGDYKLYIGTSVAETRKSDSLLYTHNQNDLIVTERLTTRLQPKDPDVKDANKKPIFSEFMKRNTPYNYDMEKYAKIQKKYYEEKLNNYIQNHKDVNVDKNEQYTNIPIFKFNDINFKTVVEKKNTFDELVDTMTDEEIAFLHYGHTGNIRSGTGTIGGLYNSGITGKYLIPSGDTLDGPAGLRQSDPSLGSTAWPCSTLLASTFDVDIMRQVGEETGKEARKIGCSFWLAPGMNIHRSPLCGRNFEYYSEDPFLVGKMAAAITKGLESKRVSITLKHFAFNDKEVNRGGERDPDNNLASDSRMAERVAREIYLKGFEIAVKEGGPWAIMSSYNRMNGMKTAESYDLLTGILRGEWKYDGLVMTDWFSNSKNDREAHAGNDVKMPFGSTDDILNGIATGIVNRNELKRNAVRILKTLSKTAAIDNLFKKPEAILLNETKRIKVVENIYDKANGIYFEDCQDEDKGFNPSNTVSNSWVTILVNNPEERYAKIRVRYASLYEGFGVVFKKYEKALGEMTNLNVSGGYQNWVTSPTMTVFLPKGQFELTVMFAGYDFVSSWGKEHKGNVNWIEIEK